MRHTLRKMAWLTLATFVLVSAAAWAQGGGTYSEADRARFEQQAQKRAEILRRNEEAEEKKKAEAAARARQAEEANRAYRERLRREAHSQPNCPPGRPHPGVFGPQPYYNPWGFPPNPWFNGPQQTVPVAPRVSAPQPEPSPGPLPLTPSTIEARNCSRCEAHWRPSPRPTP